jgi:hypothetical protein
MVVDDGLKERIQEMLDSGKYPNFGSLYRYLRENRLYAGSQTYFRIEVEDAGLDIPKGFGRRKKGPPCSHEGLDGIVAEPSEAEQRVLENKKKALQRARNFEIGYTDIAYFLEMNIYFVRKNMRYRGILNGKRFEAGRVGKKKTLEHLYYKHAAQVYEQLATGSTPEEIQTTLKMSEEAYRYIIEKREKIEPKIIATLRILYNQPTHNVPYVTPELKEHLKAA